MSSSGAMQFKKGFLNAGDAPKKKKESRRKKNALPDSAYLPQEEYDLEADDGMEDNPLVAEIETSEQAYEYSVDFCRSHMNQFNQGLMKLDPFIYASFSHDLHAVYFNRKLWGHHDGHGKGGVKRTMLLPSGIVLHYTEWGNETAPPLVMLHDVCDCCHVWDDIARPLSDKYRVLSPDLRGHGETSRSPRREYGVEHLVGDLHELVVRLSLNGREWGGAFTRPWVLCGKGMGGAVAVAYAAMHAGRVAGLMLWDYDPEMKKDRLNFNPYQAAHFSTQESLAHHLAELYGLKNDAKYLSILWTNRAEFINFDDVSQGCRFKMDPYFFLSDMSPGVAWTQLRAVTAKCRVLLVHTQNSRDWTYQRAAEVLRMLEAGSEAGPPLGAALVVASRGSCLDEEKNLVEDISVVCTSIANHVLAFADDIDKQARSKLKQEGAVRYEKITEEDEETKEAERRAIRLQAREAAGFMRKDDPPPPSFDQFDD